MGSPRADNHEPPQVGPPREDDAWLWLSDQWWTPWVILIVSLIATLWMLRSLVIHRGRVEQVKDAALAAGMRFQEQDGPGIARTRFQHLANGVGQGWTASNIVTLGDGSSEGRDVHAFDARSWTEYDVVDGGEGGTQVRRRRPRGSGHMGGRVMRRYVGATTSGAVATLPLNAPRTLIAKENIASKLFTAATRLDLDVESDLFNRSYHVISESRDFARAILDARMIDLMVSTEGRVSFEFFGRYLLLHTVRLEPELMPGLARLAQLMRGVVPQLAIDRWPTGGRMARDMGSS